MFYKFGQKKYMVGVAQLVEHRVVAPVVVGSSPITHPIPTLKKAVIFRSPPFFWGSQEITLQYI
jgi:hypothetical protein